MDPNKVSIFLASNSNKFMPQHIIAIKNQLTEMEDDALAIVQSIPYRDPTTVLILSIVVGYLGVDRFMVGDIGLGVLKLLTCGGGGIWTIVDWFVIMNRTKEYNYQKFMEVTGTTLYY